MMDVMMRDKDGNFKAVKQLLQAITPEQKRKIEQKYDDPLILIT